MSNIIIQGENAVQAERLAIIEGRIRDNMNRAAESLLDIGRCLNQAKDEKLVPHGQWQAWVQHHTGMTVRGAQRVMQAAREVSNTSTLTHLEFSKISALLALPAGEREAFAEEVHADEMSVRELKTAIEAKQAAEAEREAEQKRRMEVENALRKRDILEAEQRSRLLQEMDDLREQLNAAQENGETLAEIERLQAENAELEEEIIRRANAEAKVKQELLALRSQMARGGGSSAGADNKFTPEALGEATRAFIGRAAVLPHMRSELATCDHNTRAAYRTHVEMMMDWCERAMRAIDTITGEVIEV